MAPDRSKSAVPAASQAQAPVRPLTTEFFAAALDAALAPPSAGVVFWSWPPLSEDTAKQEILSNRAR